MLLVLDNLAPVFLLIVLGYGLARLRVVPPEGWVGLERLLYFAAFPALIVQSIARAEPAGGSSLALVATLAGAQAATTALAVALRPLVLGRLGAGRPAFTSLVQGVVRWNALVAVALVGKLFGRDAVALAAYGLAVMIPFANVVSVTALAIDGEHRADASGAALALMVLRQLAGNPLILAVAAGLAASASGLPLPGMVDTTLGMLGQASIATGLLLVGAGLDPATALRPDGPVLLAALLKLVATPALMLGFGAALGLDATTLSVAVLCGAVPTASASYVLARRMGGDAPLMARIVATQSLAALVTMPLAIAAAGLVAGAR